MLPDIIFMMGPSGVGKGTQSEFLVKKYGYFHWEMGAILRGMHDYKMRSGQTLGEYIAAGNFVSDEEIMEIFHARIATIPADQRIIFDGLPRRLGQAQEVVEFLKEKGKRMMTIYLDAHEEELIRRLTERAKTQGREDDHIDAIRHRLAQFNELTLPAVNYLKTVTEFYDVDSRPPIPEVAASIDAILTKHDG